jgi:small-conductance mechanosensitive channel
MIFKWPVWQRNQALIIWSNLVKDLLFLSVCLSLSLFLSLSLSLTICNSFCTSLFLCLCLCISVSLFLCVVPDCLCVWLPLCLSWWIIWHFHYMIDWLIVPVLLIFKQLLFSVLGHGVVTVGIALEWNILFLYIFIPGTCKEAYRHNSHKACRRFSRLTSFVTSTIHQNGHSLLI